MIVHWRKIQSGQVLVITGGCSLEEDSIRSQVLVITGDCSLEEDSIRTQVWSSQVVVHWRKIQSGQVLVITGGCSLEEDSIRTQVLVITGDCSLEEDSIRTGPGHHRWLFTGGRFNQDRSWSSQEVLHWRKIQSGRRSGHQGCCLLKEDVE